jgi:hypothetical protein
MSQRYEKFLNCARDWGVFFLPGDVFFSAGERLNTLSKPQVSGAKAEVSNNKT